MRKTSLLLAVALFVGGATSAVAQTAQLPRPVPPPRVTDVAPAVRGLDQIEAESFRRLRTPGGDVVNREALADRVAALVDAGKCDEARQEARRGGDRAMARRIGRICRSASEHR